MWWVDDAMLDGNLLNLEKDWSSAFPASEPLPKNNHHPKKCFFICGDRPCSLRNLMNLGIVLYYLWFRYLLKFDPRSLYFIYFSLDQSMCDIPVWTCKSHVKIGPAIWTPKTLNFYSLFWGQKSRLFNHYPSLLLYISTNFIIRLNSGSLNVRTQYNIM